MAEQQNQQKKQNQEPDLNQLLKVRREKLAELQAAGKDPFQITKYDVTVHSLMHPLLCHGNSAHFSGKAHLTENNHLRIHRPVLHAGHKRQNNRKIQGRFVHLHPTGDIYVSVIT